MKAKIKADSKKQQADTKMKETDMKAEQNINTES